MRIKSTKFHLSDINVNKSTGQPTILTFKVIDSLKENKSIEVAERLIPVRNYRHIAAEVGENLPAFTRGELHDILTNADGKVLMRTTPQKSDAEASIELIFLSNKPEILQGAEVVALRSACELLHKNNIIDYSEMLKLHRQLMPTQGKSV